MSFSITPPYSISRLHTRHLPAVLWKRRLQRFPPPLGSDPGLAVMPPVSTSCMDLWMARLTERMLCSVLITDSLPGTAITFLCILIPALLFIVSHFINCSCCSIDTKHDSYEQCNNVSMLLVTYFSFLEVMLLMKSVQQFQLQSISELQWKTIL